DSTILYSTITYKNQEQDQNFLLTILLNKIQRFTKANLHLTEKFTIIELIIAKTKGAPKKRKMSDVEKQVSKKSKPINKQERITINKENKQENSLKTLCLGCNVSLINQLKKQK
ncbi:14583_t:CDS:2, partial [Dentiscutata heterogama]